MQDYNWLLTTIAQSSAALVGISSGFLILRLQMLYNRRRDIIREMDKIENQLEKYFDTSRVDIAMEEASPLLLEMSVLGNPWYKLKSELIEFPHIVWLGIVGIIWLLLFSIIYPVSIIPEPNLNWHFTYINLPFFSANIFFKTISFLKVTFFIGLGILFLYFVCEIINYWNFKERKKELNITLSVMLEDANKIVAKSMKEAQKKAEEKYMGEKNKNNKDTN